MKTAFRRTALASIAILSLLFGASAAVAESPQTLTATMTGGVSNLGNQSYNVSGGQVAFAAIAGQTLNPSSTIQYSFTATQIGLKTSGVASLQLTGTTTGGANVEVSGNFNINSIIPAAELPTGCSTNCQSALPFFFVATSPNVQMTVGTTIQTVAETLQIESPYFNPWGGPIMLASADNSIVIAATYTHGSIVWTGSKVGGTISGTVGTTPASGMFNMTTGENENLVTGVAVDTGTIAFSALTPKFLNDRGTYTGTSTIPTSNTTDCSASTGIRGTCTETGFQSTGQFTMDKLVGSYTTTWGVPALGFYSSVSATYAK